MHTFPLTIIEGIDCIRHHIYYLALPVQEQCHRLSPTSYKGRSPNLAVSYLLDVHGDRGVDISLTSYLRLAA